MTRRGSRLLQAALLATASAGLLELTSVLNPGVGLADDTALIMGYAETPNPLPVYVDNVMHYFIDPNPAMFDGQPTYDGYSPLVVPTEEGANYALVQSLGAQQLDAAIQQALGSSDSGNNVVVWGYSESSTIATQELVNLQAAGNPYNPDNLQFVLLENLNNPNGGFLERFPDLAGTPFPATPSDTPYDVTIYTVQYSGSSDFPEYTSNLLAYENAMAGFVDLHPLFLPGYPSSFDFSSIHDAVLQPVSSADVNTDYYLIPTQNLPLLDLSRELGGNAFADLVQPDMRVIIDLGYNYTGDADVLTPADYSAPDIDMTAVNDYLVAGANQGIVAMLVDYGLLPQSDLSDLYPYVPDIVGLQAGALTDNVAAADIASTSANALLADLAASSNPFVNDLSSFLPGFATGLAGYFELMANSL